jgi:hypothetical protein
MFWQQRQQLYAALPVALINTFTFHRKLRDKDEKIGLSRS